MKTQDLLNKRALLVKELEQLDLQLMKIKTSDKILNKNTNILISIKDLVKTYGDKKVLNKINLDIYEQDQIAIVGFNGAGKTTLVEIIAQIKNQTSGTIDYSFGKTKKEISNQIGIQFQETTFPIRLKVKEIILFFKDLSSSTITDEELDKLIDLFNVRELLSLKAKKMSGGQKQRVNSLLSIINNPKLLILDEVGTGLDVETWTNIKGFLNNYLEKSKTTLIIVSHRADEILLFAKRVVVINEGKIYSDTTIEKILKNYGSVDSYLNKLFTIELKRKEVE